MGDGPDLFEMGWSNKPPVVATAAASPHQGISHRPEIPGAVVIVVSCFQHRGFNLWLSVCR